MTPLQRFWLKIKVDLVTGCWEWTGTQNELGYGIFGADGKKFRAHRFSYIAFIGDIPEGLGLDHLCRNPPCCNPSHLEAVTQKVNNLRGTSPAAMCARKTACPLGHPLSGSNLYINPNTGKRRCRECMRRDARETSRRRPRKGPAKMCMHGHPWTPENTKIVVRNGGKNNHRVCRTCEKAREARYKLEGRYK